MPVDAAGSEGDGAARAGDGTFQALHRTFEASHRTFQALHRTFQSRSTAQLTGRGIDPIEAEREEWHGVVEVLRADPRRR